MDLFSGFYVIDGGTCVKRKKAAAKYHMQIVLIWICTVLLSACGKKQVEQMEFENLQVVQIDCEHHKGSGVVYAAPGGDVVVITAAHVLDDAENATVVWKTEADENDVKPDTISKVTGLDLAFLNIEGAVFRQESVQESVEKDENQVILRGYDGAGELHETAGSVSHSWIYVEDFGCHMMIVKAETVPGMSGGGAFYANGEFVGIICGTDEKGNAAILPASVIFAEYGVKFGK